MNPNSIISFCGLLLFNQLYIINTDRIRILTTEQTENTETRKKVFVPCIQCIPWFVISICC
jgi:hypothetical protein